VGWGGVGGGGIEVCRVRCLLLVAARELPRDPHPKGMVTRALAHDMQGM